MHKCFDHVLREPALVAGSGLAYIATVPIPESRGYVGASPPPVRIYVADQDLVGGCVAADVVWVGGTVPPTMMGVCLMPFARSVLAIDVVTECLLEAPAEIWFFLWDHSANQYWLNVIVFCYSHDVDETALPLHGATAGADYPVAYTGHVANSRLAGRERASAMERIRSEAIVTSDDIGKEPHVRAHLTAAMAWYVAGRIGVPSGVSDPSIFPLIASTMRFPVQPTTASA